MHDKVTRKSTPRENEIATSDQLAFFWGQRLGVWWDHNRQLPGFVFNGGH
jgi:hypothetical protein